MIALLAFIIIIGIIGSVAFLNIDKKIVADEKNDADDYEIVELQ